MLGHAVLARFFLSEGGDIEARRQISRETPLILAAAYGHVRCVELLVDYGADMHARDAKKRKPKALALARGDPKGRLVADVLTKKERQGGEGRSIFRGWFARLRGRRMDAHVDSGSDAYRQHGHSNSDGGHTSQGNAAGKKSHESPSSAGRMRRKEDQPGEKRTYIHSIWSDHLVFPGISWVRVWWMSAFGFLGTMVAMFFSGDLDLFLVVH
jgi:hypothetical protein